MQHLGAATGRGADRSAESGTIVICFVETALESIRSRRLDADDLLQRVGISPILLQVPQARVSAKHYADRKWTGTSPGESRRSLQL